MTFTFPTDAYDRVVRHPNGQVYEYDAPTESWNLLRPTEDPVEEPYEEDMVFPMKPPDGAITINTNTGTIYEYTSEHERWYVLIQVPEKGEKGYIGFSHKGEKGHKGSKGELAEKGNKGSKGEKGELNVVVAVKGFKGEKGDKGTKGEKGHKGIVGPKGNNGKGGDKGEKGVKGPKGEIGEKGRKGEKHFGHFGNQGNQGPQGEKGELGGETYGDPGPDGPKGHRGDQGPRGEKGFPGPPGNRGGDGSTGNQGQKGPKGNRGSNGGNGSSGSNGAKPSGQNWSFGTWTGATNAKHNSSGVKSTGGWNRNTGGSTASINGNGRFRTLGKYFVRTKGEAEEPTPTTMFVERMLPDLTLERGEFKARPGDFAYFINWNGFKDERMYWNDEEDLAAESFEVGLIVATKWMQHLQDALEDLD